MSLLLKDPAAVLDYAVDWGEDYLEADRLATSHWTIAPVEDGGLSLVSEAIEATLAVVTVGGGCAGHVYRLTNHVATMDGRSDSRSVTIRVEAR